MNVWTKLLQRRVFVLLCGKLTCLVCCPSCDLPPDRMLHVGNSVITLFCRIGYIDILTKMRPRCTRPSLKPTPVLQCEMFSRSNTKAARIREDICERCVIFKWGSRDRLWCWHWSFVLEPFIFHPTKWKCLGQENYFYNSNTSGFRCDVFAWDGSERGEEKKVVVVKTDFHFYKFVQEMPLLLCMTDELMATGQTPAMLLIWNYGNKATHHKESGTAAGAGTDCSPQHPWQGLNIWYLMTPLDFVPSLRTCCMTFRMCRCAL